MLRCQLQLILDIFSRMLTRMLSLKLGATAGKTSSKNTKEKTMRCSVLQLPPVPHHQILQSRRKAWPVQMSGKLCRSQNRRRILLCRKVLALFPAFLASPVYSMRFLAVPCSFPFRSCCGLLLALGRCASYHFPSAAFHAVPQSYQTPIQLPSLGTPCSWMLLEVCMSSIGSAASPFSSLGYPKHLNCHPFLARWNLSL